MTDTQHPLVEGLLRVHAIIVQARSNADSGRREPDPYALGQALALMPSLIEQARQCEGQGVDEPDRLIMACEEVLRLMKQWKKRLAYSDVCRVATERLRAEMVLYLRAPQPEPQDHVTGSGKMVPQVSAEVVETLKAASNGNLTGKCSECGDWCGGCIQCDCKHAHWETLTMQELAKAALATIQQGGGHD